MARLLDVPILLTEQYPEGLGPTVPELGAQGIRPVSKTCFSMVPALQKELDGRSQLQSVLLCGIETQACILVRPSLPVPWMPHPHLLALPPALGPWLSLPHPHSQYPVLTWTPQSLTGALFVLPLEHSSGPTSPGTAGSCSGGCLFFSKVRGSLWGWHLPCVSSGAPQRAHPPSFPLSCSQVDRLVALARMRQSGAFLATSESLILQLVRDASHPQFKEVLGHLGFCE